MDRLCFRREVEKTKGLFRLRRDRQTDRQTDRQKTDRHNSKALNFISQGL